MDSFIKENMQTLKELIVKISTIPSPSHFEYEKANFIHNWLSENGIQSKIDEKNNVICTVGDLEKEKIVFMAHIDTVFPFETKLTPVIKDDILSCAGCGDNSTNVASMLLALKYIYKNDLKFPTCCLTFVFDSGEEGLGNLYGCKHFVDNTINIKEFIAVDGDYNGDICGNAVGSLRYKISVTTQGGHSFYDFGNDNAIQILAKLIEKIYSMQIPSKENTKSTFNVGTISGGTSVNTIAQNAEMFFEIRSDNIDCLNNLKEQFDCIIDSFSDFDIKVNIVGERPCANNIDINKQEELLNRYENIYEKILGQKPIRSSNSMDTNIPFSKGIPSTSIGTYIGGGQHTKEEWIDLNSLENGMEILLSSIKQYC